MSSSSSKPTSSTYPPPSPNPPSPNHADPTTQHQAAPVPTDNFRYAQRPQDMSDSQSRRPYSTANEPQVHQLRPKHQLDPSSFASTPPSVQPSLPHQPYYQEAEHTDSQQSLQPTASTSTRGRKRSVSDSIPESAKPPTKRIFQACDKCREMKAKCDGAKPYCSHCAARALVCVYASERRMRGPNKKREPGEPAPKRRQTSYNPTPPRARGDHDMTGPHASFQYAQYPGHQYDPHYSPQNFHPQYVGQSGYPQSGYHTPDQPGPSGGHIMHQQPPYPQMEMSMHIVDHQMYAEQHSHSAHDPSAHGTENQGLNINAYPTLEQFVQIVEAYIASLTAKNRDRTLLSQATYNRILYVLAHPESAPEDDPAVDVAQFRTWVRKNFSLKNLNGLDVVIHNTKAVAVQEQLYEILLHCHSQTRHGGREKTTSMVNDHYSWIPKALIDSFVRACPGCPRKAHALLRAREDEALRAGLAGIPPAPADTSDDPLRHNTPSDTSAHQVDAALRESDPEDGEGSPGDDRVTASPPAKGRRHSTRANLKTSNVRSKPHPKSTSEGDGGARAGEGASDRRTQSAHGGKRVDPAQVPTVPAEPSENTVSAPQKTRAKGKGAKRGGKAGADGRGNVEMEDLVKVADLVMHDAAE